MGERYLLGHGWSACLGSTRCLLARAAVDALTQQI